MNASDSTMAPAVERVIARLQVLYGAWNRHTTVQHMRRDWDAAFRSDRGTCERFSASGVPAAWVTAGDTRTDKVILYLHGGGYRIGSINSHRDLIVRITEAGSCRALAIDYRLAPEHRFPAAIEDAKTAFRWLRDQGFAANDIAIAGDSAGGNLALAAMQALRDEGAALPCAAALLSPWTDMLASGETFVSRAECDPIHTRAMILALAGDYLGDHDPHDPLASPLYADLKGLPPLLIQAGDSETVLDDSRRLAENAEAAGVETQLEVSDGMIHVFQMFTSELAEAEHAIGSIGKFLRRHLKIDV